MLRSALLVVSGNTAGSLFLLARNLLIARLIPVADYGIAATFATMLALVEMGSQLGLQKQIVQAKDGDDPKFQAALQGFHLLRGVISAALVFLIAHPLAQFLGIPEVAWAYQLLALVPLMLGFEHFDIHRLSRQTRFWPMFLTMSCPAILTFLMAWPLSIWLPDWRLMLYLMLAFPFFIAVTSQLTAERRYQIRLDPAVMGRSLKFGWPLLVNSALMYLIFHGDKLIVGRELGMEALAIFAIGVTFTLTPTLVLGRSLELMFLPKLSAAAHDDDTDFARMAQLALQAVSLAALGFVLGLVLVGAPAVHLLLGAKFDALIPLLIWFSIGQGIRMMKTGPGIVMFSQAKTSTAMIANIARVLVLPLAWWAVAQGYGMFAVLCIAIAGESVGFVVALALMLRHTGLPAGPILWQQGLVLAIMVFIGAWAWIQPTERLFVWQSWLAAPAIFLAAALAMPDINRFLRRQRRA